MTDFDDCLSQLLEIPGEGLTAETWDETVRSAHDVVFPRERLRLSQKE